MINSFRGRYGWLSNFWAAPVLFEGIVYPTAEHAYQAAKTSDPVTRAYISQLPTPGRAKQHGGKLVLRLGWNHLRVGVMRTILQSKFRSGSRLAELLLSTGDEFLVEGNFWGDTFWGVCGGVGENTLGRLLMEIREDLETG